MAIYRVERTRDYTVMSNHHLKDRGLSLKAKGLLSMILSLPDEWNYTLRGLAAISKEGVDAIGSAVRELEKAGYIIGGSCGALTDGLAIPSTPFMSSRIKLCRIIRQMWKFLILISQIWIFPIWLSQFRKQPQN